MPVVPHRPILTSPLPGRNAIYAAALNRRVALDILGDALHRSPYLAPPKAPVLHLKPANTWSRSGAPVRCPPGVAALRMGGSVGMVIGRRATRLAPGEAMSSVAGLIVVNDVHLPYQSHFRPAIKERCRDGFCPLGIAVPSQGIDPGSLTVIIEVDGRIVCREPSDYLRDPATLLADVTAFLTLGEGDILLLGEPVEPPLAAPGATVRVVIEGVGEVMNPVTT